MAKYISILELNLKTTELDLSFSPERGANKRPLLMHAVKFSLYTTKPEGKNPGYEQLPKENTNRKKKNISPRTQQICQIEHRLANGMVIYF